MNRFLRFFEQYAEPFKRPFLDYPPKAGLGYILHYVKHLKGAFSAMLVFGTLQAIVEASIFMFVGVIVDQMNEGTAATFFSDNASTLIGMAVVVIVIRVFIAIGTAVVEEQIVVPDFFTLVRWQGHLAVSRQDVSFFDDEMAGRIHSKVWQTGHAAGDFMVSLLQIILFIFVFALTTLVVIAGLDWRMIIPVIFWLTLVGLIAWYFVPKIRDRGRELAEVTAVVTGRMVDGYSNIRTVKLYGAEDAQDEFIKAAWRDTLVVLRDFTRVISGMRITSQFLSSAMLVIIGALASWLYSVDALTAGQVAIILALCLRLNLLMGRLLGLLNGLFRNFGTIQNSAGLISRTPEIKDAPDAEILPVVEGDVNFADLNFSYPGTSEIIQNLTLDIPAGQKIGLVGQSGVGKTTLMNLLLRFYDINDGTISVDGHDIMSVTQHSLRQQIGVVTQDPSLLHRSVRDNIAYGRPDATQEEIEKAAKRAKAHEFILGLEDVKGRTGYDTHVGERGVKLSGGQRQRIALARVFLKDAPILLLDEATSALDSEIEAAIQEHLADLMEGKTVIAIAHRLSTIAHLDRLIVMDEGRIVEDGKHDELLKAKGHYAALWKRQSGGFLSN